MKKVNKQDYFKDILQTLKELKEEFPNETIALHLGLASEGYSHIEDIPSDKELSFLLNKYQAAKVLDHTIPFTEDYDIEEEEDGYY